MAERRMFSKSIVYSARFLRLPATARLLYYDLGMYADDDGVVEAFPVMRMTGATEEDLRALADRDFVDIMTDDLITYIYDWARNNQLRKDRYKQSVYASLLRNHGHHPGTAAKEQPDGNQMATNGKPSIV